MSTYTSEPGTRLAGRYLLVDQAIGGTDWTYWKAIDETLARSVTVLTFAAGCDRVAEAVAAARAASRLNDPRFSQVFDVEDADGSAYVVLEWVASESLLDMLADGPLDPPRAVSLIAEAARALAAAHAHGLAHLRLDPECVHWTTRGGIKITGLGLAAALTGGQTSAADGEDPELADTRGLARLLYAALTGYWPESQGYTRAFGPGEAAEPESDHASVVLPPAPLADGMPCTPRQVSAAVPTNIDALTCQALFQRPSRHGPALSTPAKFADALASVAPPAPLPVPAPATAPVRPSASGRAPSYQPTGPTSAYPAVDPARTTLDEDAYRPPRSLRRPPPTRVILAVVIGVVLVAAGVVGWSLSHRTGHSGSPQAGQSSSSSSSGPNTAASNVLRPAGANSFDPLGSSKDENGNEAQYAIDNNPSTFWHTDFYDNYPTFGNLKTGTGLILDMGGPVRLSQVVVQFGTICCAHVEIEIGNDNSLAAATLKTFTQVQSSDNAVGGTTFDVTSHATGRYVLIWITYLPRMAGSSNRYEALIYNIVVHGSPVSQSG
ncbi:MAG: discoidin domain-containing protein [Streptosporangiaceae bacterium]